MPALPPAARARAEAILGDFAGAHPNGEPAGVLAYALANAVEPRAFRPDADGLPTPLPPGAPCPPDGWTVPMPVWRPVDPTPPRLHYAVIDTDPTGASVLTVPRGTRDLLVRPAAGPPYRVELGQRRTLLDLLARLRPAERARWPETPPPGTDWAGDLRRLHVAIVAALLADGAGVEVEPVADAAIRETREEHGFDLADRPERLVRLDLFVEPAPSKRRAGGPIDHWIHAAWVTDFDGVRPRRSVITDEKNPRRLGRRYVEQGTFATLPAMRERLRRARAETAAGGAPSAEVALGIETTAGRLAMLGRIERALVADLRGLGLSVASAEREPPATPRARLAFHPARVPSMKR